MIVKKIINDTYDSEFIFVIADTHDEVLDKFGIDWNENGGCLGLDDKIYIIIHPDVELDILVHECDHAISEMWKSYGIKKMKGIDESYSYMLSWLFKKCYNIKLKYDISKNE